MLSTMLSPTKLPTPQVVIKQSNSIPDWLDYEFFACQYHRDKFNHVTYHWSVVPEPILKASGFIHNYNELRLSRKFNQEKFKSSPVYYNPVQEYGLDGIAVENKDGKAIYHGIQCKNWKYSLCGKDLGTFYQAMFRLFQVNKDSMGYLYHSGPLHETLRCDLQRFPSLKAIKLDHAVKPIMINANIRETDVRLYDFQVEAIAALDANMKGICHLNLPSGSGKTVIVANHLRNKRYRNVFIMSPLRVHTKQNLKRIKPFLSGYKSLLLDSDGTCNFNRVKSLIGKPSIISTTFKSAKDVLIKLFDTNPVIKKKKVVFKLRQPNTDNKPIAAELETPEYTGDDEAFVQEEAICFDDELDGNEVEDKLDEAELDEEELNEEDLNSDELDEDELEELNEEDLDGDELDEDELDELDELDESDEFDELDESNNEISDSDESVEELEINGYPCNYDLSDSILIVDEAHNLVRKKDLIRIVKSFPNVLLVTATPPNQMKKLVGGETIYHYPLSRAIKEQKVCDYRIYLPLITSKNTAENIEIPSELKELDNNICKKTLFLINGLLRTGSRHCIVYLNSIAECTLFKKVFIQIMTQYHGLAYWIEHITSNVSKAKQEECLKEFQKSGQGTIKILTAIRILDECIDVPKCDSVFITSVGKHVSDIRTIQRICRANRLDRQHPNKMASCFFWVDELHNVIKSLKILKESDLEFTAKVNMINGNYDTNETETAIKAETSINIDFQKFIDIKCLSFKELWDYKHNILIDFVKTFDRVPTQTEIYKDIKIGSWFHEQKRKIINIADDLYLFLAQNVIIKTALDSYLNRVELLSTADQLKIIFQFVDEYKRTPKSIDIYETFPIGMWYARIKSIVISNQDNVYKTLSTNDIVKTNVDLMLDKRVNFKTQDAKKELLFEFVKEYKRLPTQKENYQNIAIGGWYATQKKTINTNKDKNYEVLSVDPLIKTDLDNLLQYKEVNKAKIIYTRKENIQQLFEFVEKFKRVPSCKDTYKDRHIRDVLNYLKSKIKSTDEQLYKELASNELLKSHLDKYLDQKSKTLTQDTLLQLFLNFVEMHKRIPSRREKIDGVSLGEWYSRRKSLIETTDDENYIKLSVSAPIKDDIDKLLLSRPNEKTFDEKLNLLFEYVKEYKKAPPDRIKYQNIPLGSWFFNLKEKITSTDDELYKIFSINEIIKANIDASLNRRKLKLKKPIMTQKEKFELLIEFNEKNKRMPYIKEIYKDIAIGRWFVEKRSRIASTEDIIYKHLSTNSFIKTHLDKFFETRKEPKKIKIV